MTFDATAQGTALPATSISFSHVCTGKNLILIVAIVINGTNTDLISSVTYNGVSMTQINKEPDPGTNIITYLYYLVAPATGSNTVAIAWDGASRFVRAISASYTGAVQSGQPDANGVANVSTATTITGSLTIMKSGSWVVGLVGNSSGNAETAGAGVNATRNSVTTFLYFADSNGGKSSGSYSMTWTHANNTAVNVNMASIAALPTGGLLLSDI